MTQKENLTTEVGANEGDNKADVVDLTSNLDSEIRALLELYDIDKSPRLPLALDLIKTLALPESNDTLVEIKDAQLERINLEARNVFPQLYERRTPNSLTPVAQINRRLEQLRNQGDYPIAA